MPVPVTRTGVEGRLRAEGATADAWQHGKGVRDLAALAARFRPGMERRVSWRLRGRKNCDGGR
jgi:hypothetical protein